MSETVKGTTGPNRPRSGRQIPADNRAALAIAVTKLKGPVKFRAINAITGFERALKLIEIDREMASFRAITAEEEAAAALFMALKLRGYPGSDKLNVGNHRHKAALGPFLQAVRTSLADGPVRNLKVTFDYRAPYLHLHFPLSDLGVPSPPGMDYQMTLEEPLHIHSETGGKIDLFEREIEAVASASQFSSIDRLVSKQANDRNILLYASDSGVPQSKATVDTIVFRRDRGELALFLAIAIMQTKTLQLLALRALDAFVRLTGQELAEPMPYPKSPDVEIEIKLKAAEPSKVTFTPAAARKAHGSASASPPAEEA